MIVKIEQNEKTFFVPGFGYRNVKNLEKFEKDDKFGLALKTYFPQIVFEEKTETDKDITKVDDKSEETQESNLEDETQEELELLEEEPESPLELVDEAETVIEETREKVTLKPLEEFESITSNKEAKLALESYGKELGIDLSRQKSLKNMYEDLVTFVS